SLRECSGPRLKTAVRTGKGRSHAGAAAVKFDALAPRCADNGLAADQAAMQLIVEGPPRPGGFIALAEGVAGDRHRFKAAIKPLRAEYGTPAHIPLAITLVALHAPGRMPDDRGGVGVEAQGLAMQNRGVDDVVAPLVPDQDAAVGGGDGWGDQHGAQPARGLEADRRERR